MAYGYTHADTRRHDADDSARSPRSAGRWRRTNGYTPEQSSDLYIADGTIIDWLWGRTDLRVHLRDVPAQLEPGFLPARRADRRARRPATARPSLTLLETADCPYRAIGKQAQYCGGAPPPGDALLRRLRVRQRLEANAQGTDTATAGRFERGDPAATTGGAKQLGTTMSGVNDLVTGRARGRRRGRPRRRRRAHLDHLAADRADRLGGYRWLRVVPRRTAPTRRRADFLRVRRLSAARPADRVPQAGAAANRNGAWAPRTVIARRVRRADRAARGRGGRRLTRQPRRGRGRRREGHPAVRDDRDALAARVRSEGVRGLLEPDPPPDPASPDRRRRRRRGAAARDSGARPCRARRRSRAPGPRPRPSAPAARARRRRAGRPGRAGRACAGRIDAPAVAALPSASIDTWAPPPVSSCDRRDRVASPRRRVLGAELSAPAASGSGAMSTAITRAPRAARDHSRPTARRRRSRARPPSRRRARGRGRDRRGTRCRSGSRAPAAARSPARSGIGDQVQLGDRARHALGERAPAREIRLVVGARTSWCARRGTARTPSAAAERRRHPVARRESPRRRRRPPRRRRRTRGRAHAESGSSESWPIQPYPSLRHSPVARTSITAPSGPGSGSATPMAQRAPRRRA